jgi:hypothetical protein
MTTNRPNQTEPKIYYININTDIILTAYRYTNKSPTVQFLTHISNTYLNTAPHSSLVHMLNRYLNTVPHLIVLFIMFNRCLNTAPYFRVSFICSTDIWIEPHTWQSCSSSSTDVWIQPHSLDSISYVQQLSQLRLTLESLLYVSLRYLNTVPYLKGMFTCSIDIWIQLHNWDFCSYVQQIYNYSPTFEYPCSHIQ